MKPFLFAAITSLLFTSCYTYKIFPSKNATDNSEMPRKKAYVMNPGLKKEYSILYNSDIFDISNDSTDNSAVKIVLYPMESGIFCSQTIPLSVILLGQVPETFRNKHQFKFDEISGDSLKENKIDLHMGQQVWFWHMFVFKKKFDEKAGKLLQKEYQ